MISALVLYTEGNFNDCSHGNFRTRQIVLGVGNGTRMGGCAVACLEVYVCGGEQLIYLRRSMTDNVGNGGILGLVIFLGVKHYLAVSGNGGGAGGDLSHDLIALAYHIILKLEICKGLLCRLDGLSLNTGNGNIKSRKLFIGIFGIIAQIGKCVLENCRYNGSGDHAAVIYLRTVVVSALRLIDHYKHDYLGVVCGSKAYV